MNFLKTVELPIKFISGKKTFKQVFNYLKYKLSSPAENYVNYAPIVLSISATDKCNLKCDMCLAHSQRAELNAFKHQAAPDISFELFRKVADKFESALSLQLIGSGEPLLNKDFFRMVEYAAKQKKMEVFTTSNGTLLDRYSDKIIDSPLTGINISLNGHNGEEFNRLTGENPEKYQKIRDNIQSLTTKKRETGSPLNVSVSYVLDQHNYPFMEEMLTYAESLGVDEVWFSNYLSLVDVAGYSTRERSLFSDMDEVVAVMTGLRNKRFKVKYQLPALLNRRPGRKCRVYFTHIRVDSNGEVGSCGRMLLNLSGNGYYDDPDVWNNDYYRKMRATCFNLDLPLPEPCKRCPCNSGNNF